MNHTPKRQNTNEQRGRLVQGEIHRYSEIRHVDAFDNSQALATRLARPYTHFSDKRHEVLRGVWRLIFSPQQVHGNQTPFPSNKSESLLGRYLRAFQDYWEWKQQFPFRGKKRVHRGDSLGLLLVSDSVDCLGIHFSNCFSSRSKTNWDFIYIN